MAYTSTPPTDTSHPSTPNRAHTPHTPHTPYASYATHTIPHTPNRSHTPSTAGAAGTAGTFMDMDEAMRLYGHTNGHGHDRSGHETALASLEGPLEASLTPFQAPMATHYSPVPPPIPRTTVSGIASPCRPDPATRAFPTLATIPITTHTSPTIPTVPTVPDTQGGVMTPTRLSATALRSMVSSPSSTATPGRAWNILTNVNFDDFSTNLSPNLIRDSQIHYSITQRIN